MLPLCRGNKRLLLVKNIANLISLMQSTTTWLKGRLIGYIWIVLPVLVNLASAPHEVWGVANNKSRELD